MRLIGIRMTIRNSCPIGILACPANTLPAIIVALNRPEVTYVH